VAKAVDGTARVFARTSGAGRYHPRVSLLFVYGTLMRGEANHGQLGGARFVETVRTAPDFELVDLGEYPAMLANGRDRIAGEIYEVDDGVLARLDPFEASASYGRTAIPLDDGRQVQAYLLPRERLENGRTIVSGDWRRR
jgi:gamma-glutamylaminecyclotransferase